MAFRFRRGKKLVQPARRRLTGTRWGSAYFETERAAEAYYGRQGESGAEVARKIADGEIHIGKPPASRYPAGSEITLDRDGRYWVQEP